MAAAPLNHMRVWNVCLCDCEVKVDDYAAEFPFRKQAPSLPPSMASAREPLLGDACPDAPASFLGHEPLSARQQRLDERIRTLCLAILSACAVLIGCYYLRVILIRFVLALAAYYLLTPIIDVLSCSGSKSGAPLAKFRLPRAIAILLALCIAASILGVLGMIVAKSIGTFAAHADVYSQRVQAIVQVLLNWASKFDPAVIPAGSDASTLQKTLAELAKQNLSLTSLILGLLGTAAQIAENVVYILLFLAFLLAGSTPRTRDGEPAGDFYQEADEQIYVYIRGKVGVALLVAVCDACILWAVGLDLWLVFGVLSFWLQFVPNVGMAIGVCLPMPLIVLDPQFATMGALVAFLGPLGVGLVAKDVIEPLVIGHSTSLTPVAVLLSVMIWGSIWGITGMVLAVPMTAVLRIYLAGLEHPLPRRIALVLAGHGVPTAGAVQPI